MTGGNLDRRRFLRLGGGALAAASVVGIGVGAKAALDGDGAAETGASAGGGAKEAPDLAALVKQGKLPPLAERLPDEPAVVELVDRPGQYGGDWHTAIVGAEDAAWMLLTVYYDNVVAWKSAWEGAGSISDVRPNVAESMEFNDDGTEFTFKLRPGLKWSDGSPLTADDIVFAVNDIIMNTELSPAPNARFVGRDGSPGKAEKIDQYTAKVAFPTPNALFLQGMCSAGGWVLHAPKKYLQEFHADYNKKANKLAKQEGLASWTELFLAKNNPLNNADRPTTTAWMVTTPVGEGSQVVVERNPYYWKVDPDGRQLPYLDRVVFAVASDTEVALAQALNGQLDIHARLINTARNKPVLAKNRKRGDYDFFEVKTSFMNQGLLMLNQTCQDEVKREIFRNRDFRIGLSHAIDRTEIIESVYAGQGEPWQAAPKPGTPFFAEELSKQYTEHDVALANEHLDKSGYALEGSSRVGPDGEPIEIVMLVATTQPASVQALEFVKRAWKEVGVELQIESVDELLFFERVSANEHEAAIFPGEGGDNPILYPSRYIPTAGRTSNHATAWGLWYETHGASGEEPPANVKGWLSTYDDIKGTTSADEQNALMAEILQGVAEEFPVIGIALPPEGYGIVKNSFHNVPKSVPGDLTFPNLAGTHPEQYFAS